ncbi:hypothetical protein [Streptomyces mirabilis]|uniref:hypothetical protein n=1 Tax=Streptomyces mirabilis TaxID=68239 RepID=UPI0036A3EB6E
MCRAASRRRPRRRCAERTRRINASLVVLLVLALIATGVAFGQRQTVIGQRDRAASAQVAGVAQSVRRTDPQLGRRLAIASARLAETPESWSALLALHNQQEDDALKLPGFVATESDLDATGETVVAAGAPAWSSGTSGPAGRRVRTPLQRVSIGWTFPTTAGQPR